MEVVTGTQNLGEMMSRHRRRKCRLKQWRRLRLPQARAAKTKTAAPRRHRLTYERHTPPARTRGLPRRAGRAGYSLGERWSSRGGRRRAQCVHFGRLLERHSRECATQALAACAAAAAKTWRPATDFVHRPLHVWNLRRRQWRWRDACGRCYWPHGRLLVRVVLPVREVGASSPFV